MNDYDEARTDRARWLTVRLIFRRENALAVLAVAGLAALAYWIALT